MESPFRHLAGKPYMPSNGTEGMNFTGEFCDNCIHQHPDPNNELQCVDILLKSLIGEQPQEWVYNSMGYPTCTAFVNWNWGNDEDGWNEPPGPAPYDPTQLLIPFDITDLFGFDDPKIAVTKQAILEIN